jgi:hypothetical protein
VRVKRVDCWRIPARDDNFALLLPKLTQGDKSKAADEAVRFHFLSAFQIRTSFFQQLRDAISRNRVRPFRFDASFADAELGRSKQLPQYAFAQAAAFS